MGIRFRKEGEYVDNMGELIDKQPKGQPGVKELNPQFTKEYDDSFRGKVDDFINPGQDMNIPENNLKALLAVREELVEVRLENEILTSKLKQIYLITNSK